MSTQHHHARPQDEKYCVKNIETREYQWLTVSQILEEVNRDRSDSWQAYNEDDWFEGMNEWTNLRLVS